MSVSVFFTAIKPPDDTWRKHKAVWDACDAAEVDLPDATCQYFEGEAPDPDGVPVDLGSLNFPDHPSITRVVDSYYHTVLIDISKLPEGTQFLKVRYG